MCKMIFLFEDLEILTSAMQTFRNFSKTEAEPYFQSTIYRFAIHIILEQNSIEQSAQTSKNG